MNKIFGCLFLTCLTPAAWSAPNSGLYPIQTIDDSAATGELAPLGRLIAHSPIVGLGESVHTTGGQYQAKLRLIKYLVLEKNFRAFTLETPWGMALEATSYVNNCIGSPIDAVKSFFGVWQSKSMVRLLKWLCDYNRRNPKDPVSFYGFDTQQPWYDYLKLETFFHQTAPGDGPSLLLGLDSCFGTGYKTASEFYRSNEFRDSQHYPIDTLKHNRCVSAIRETERYLVHNSKELIRRSSRKEFDWAGIALYSLRTNQHMVFYTHRNAAASYEWRDVGMAYLFKSIRDLEFAGKKTVIWAHNFHIVKNHETISSPGNPYAGARSMGTFLKNIFSDDYKAIAITSYQTEINWGTIPAPPTPVNDSSASEWLLHQTGHRFALVDLAAGFFGSGKSYKIGQTSVVPSKHFDGLFFLDHSPPIEYWWE